LKPKNQRHLAIPAASPPEPLASFADAGLAACGQIGEHLVPVDAAIVTDGKWRAVDVVEAGLSTQPTEPKDRQRHPDSAGQGKAGLPPCVSS